MITFTVHTHTFTLDNSDWSNTQDADKAAELVIQKMNALSTEQINEIHSFIQTTSDWRDNCAGMPGEIVQDIENEVANFIFKSYYACPQSGHNLFVEAGK